MRIDRRILPHAGAVLLLLALALCVGAAESPARAAAVEPTPLGADWSADARTVRGKTGRFDVVCPAKGSPEQIWGTDVYTDDSSICTAAVHVGLLEVADGGIATVEPLPGEPAYTASTRNGVTSKSYSAWSGSFRVVSVRKGGGSPGVKMGGGSWSASARDYRGDNGGRYLYICPGGGQLRSAYGTGTYTDDSTVCTAAVHVGLITVGDGGRVAAEVRPAQRSYESTTANGVRSSAYGPWLGSFVLVGAPTARSAAASAPPTATATGTVTVGGAPFTGGTISFNKTVDVTEGSVQLKSAAGTLRVTPEGGATAAFVLVRATEKGKPIVELRLTKGDFSACPTRKTRSARASAKVVRQLWGNGKGNFRTRGKNAAATVRGTRWLTSDRCDGTLTRVTRGVVAVNDFAKHKTVTVRAGTSYLARH